MTDSGLSSSDLLLNNLEDHQVIRIDGRKVWMEGLIAQVKQYHPEYLECNGVLDLQSLQLELSNYLSVEPGASFIQQQLKSQLNDDRKLLLIINVESIDIPALTYLLGLPSICNEEGSAVTVLLVSSPELVSVLKSTPSLAVKLDGYYQEEQEVSAAPAFLPSKAAFVSIVLLSCAGFAGWYLFQKEDNATSVTAEVQQEKIESVRVDSKQPKPVKNDLAAINEPETKAETGSDKAVVASSEVASSEVANSEVISTDNASPRLATDKKKAVPTPTTDTPNPALLAELSTVVNNAKLKKAERPVVDTENRELERIKRKPALNIVSAEVVSDTPSNLKAVPQPKVVGSVARLNNEGEVRKVVENWGKAWQAQNWDSYIGSYLQKTTLYGVKMSLEEWRAFRKERLLSPKWVKLKFGKAKYTRLNSHWYRAEFYQRFEKPGYADETTKRLELTLTSTGWKIASEAADGTVVLKRGGQ